MSRVFQNKANLVTQGYRAGEHNGIDLVGAGHSLDYIVAHSDGVIAGVRANYATCDGNRGNSYGNYVLIRHSNGMYTMYAHMKYGSVTVKLGQRISKGQVIGYMGNTGNSSGAHLHFEVRDRNNKQIDPTQYIDADLPGTSANTNNNQNRKSSEEIADEVIAGKYGNGHDNRRRQIEALGYNYDEIRNIVNQKLGVKTSTTQNTTNTKTVANCKMLNLRNSASYGNNIYKAVSAGTQVEYIGMQSGWAKISYEGRTLFCGKNYLK